MKKFILNSDQYLHFSIFLDAIFEKILLNVFVRFCFKFAAQLSTGFNLLQGSIYIHNIGQNSNKLDPRKQFFNCALPKTRIKNLHCSLQVELF